MVKELIGQKKKKRLFNFGNTKITKGKTFGTLSFKIKFTSCLESRKLD